MRGRTIYGILLAMLIAQAAYCIVAQSINMWVVIVGLGVCLALTGVLYASTIRPMRAIEDGMNLLRAQDYASRLRNVGQHDTDSIVSLFNDLMDRLKAERLKHEEQNLFLQQLIEASTQGIVIMDYDERPMQVNAAAMQMLQVIKLPTLREGESVTLRSHTGMIYKVQRLSFLDRGFRHTFYLIESLTEEVRQAERNAYGRVIRTIAHEVNNTMGAVKSVMQVMADATADPTLGEVMASCLERADNMTRFISSYASLVKLPEPELRSADLAESLEMLMPFAQSMCSQAGIELQWRPLGSRRVMLDPVMWEQAIVNILKNSIESIALAGRADGQIVIEATADGMVRIIDNGAGLDDETSQQIFTPFFTTKPQGQGIGLMLVSEVLRRHACQFALATDPATQLTTFEIKFPQ